ncbi:hypothetical protein DH2020_034310 [Rehmannia glutinosa]|uniref:Reverse transcriptase Ty1/copia-type domain-containing protein n=1 Tax=Rehmannia glutinosa TaxID=99300 RepID=A0ABR0V9P2_REHGL
MFTCFFSQIEPKDVLQALDDTHWIQAMQEELNQFERNKVWELVQRPTPRLEAIRMFLVYAAHKNFTVYQMDKQAPRAWYDTLSQFLTENGFTKGKVDRTLFRIQDKKSILLVQIYVDDIIFGSTNKELCEKFSNLMQSKFEMSMMGELTFFLGLQVKQLKDGTFISQTKYTRDLMKKFGMEEKSYVKIPMNTSPKWTWMQMASLVDQTRYIALIGSLLYLTKAGRTSPFFVGVCARFQSAPKESHMTKLKRILRYLKGSQEVGLWYPKEGGFKLIGYSD